MRSALFSVKFLLMALFGLAATMLIGICGFLMVSAWQQQAQAQRRTEISGVTRHLFHAMQDVRVERGTVSAALADREPVDAATRQDIGNLRAKSVPALAGALDELSRLDINGRDRWIAELRTKIDAVDILRAQADEMVQKRSAGSTAQLNEQWFDGVGALVDGMDALASGLSSEVKLNDPFFDQMMVVKQLAWSVRADAGVERLLIGNAIAGGAKASDEWQRKIVGLRGRMEATWAALLSFVADPHTPQALSDAIALAKKDYFDKGRCRRDRRRQEHDRQPAHHRVRNCGRGRGAACRRAGDRKIGGRRRQRHPGGYEQHLAGTSGGGRNRLDIEPGVDGGNRAFP